MHSFTGLLLFDESNREEVSCRLGTDCIFFDWNEECNSYERWNQVDTDEYLEGVENLMYHTIEIWQNPDLRIESISQLFCGYLPHPLDSRIYHSPVLITLKSKKRNKSEYRNLTKKLWKTILDQWNMGRKLYTVTSYARKNTPEQTDSTTNMSESSNVIDDSCTSEEESTGVSIEHDEDEDAQSHESEEEGELDYEQHSESEIMDVHETAEEGDGEDEVVDQIYEDEDEPMDDLDAIESEGEIEESDDI
jgi:hypothetical protein